MQALPAIPAFARPQNPLAGLLVHIGTLIIGLFLFSCIGFLAMLALTGGNTTEALNLASGKTGGMDPDFVRTALLLQQGIVSFGGFVLTPLFVLRYYEKLPLRALSPNSVLIPGTLLAAGGLIILFMPFNGLVIEWNQSLKLPDFLKDFEAWASAKEAELGELTEFLTHFSNYGQFLLAIPVIAAVPALGEELFFRGIMQNRLRLIFGNTHAAVWVTALIFGIIHLQFYGLFPRMLLAVLFGYVYVYSGNLLLPVFGHFVNNGLTLVLLYANQLKMLNFDPESPGSIPWYAGLTSGLLTLGLMVYLKKQYDTLNMPTEGSTAP